MVWTHAEVKVEFNLLAGVLSDMRREYKGASLLHSRDLLHLLGGQGGVGRVGDI